MLPEVRMARIIDAIGLHQARKLSCVEAAELLGMSERHFRRLRDAYEAHGAEGIVDRRRGRMSGRRAGVDEIEWVIEEFRTRYFDFTAKHFHEAIHGRPMADGTSFVRGYTWTKSVLQGRGLTTKAPKRSAHRKKRARRPLPGMLVFQDGSQHAWLPQGPPLDLVVTLDDATSAILSAVLVEEEGTASSFIGLKQVPGLDPGIAAHGLFSALYTDRGSHYFYTPKAGEPVDKTHLTQVGRALKQLGIEHIPSYCPEGRGRMERLFGTLQSRLPPLLRQEGLASIEAANRWLATVYIPHHNARFAVSAAEEGTAFVPFVGVLDDILCVQAERVVQNDNTVRYEGRVLQIPEPRHRRHFVKVTVRVHEYPDGRLAIFHGPRRLADYEPDGTLIDQISPARTAA
jgi:winged helix-turn helix protein